MRMPACIMALLLLFCAFAPGSARAQSGGIYSIANVSVDETAASALEARNAAFARAQMLAWAQLVERLAQPEEFARIGVPAITPAILERLAISQDILEERRSGTRYLARLTINFNPSLVRQVLAEAGYTALFEQRAAPILIVPVLAGASAAFEAPWRTAWSQQGFERELQPLIPAFDLPGALNGDWAAVESAAAQVGAATAVYVITQAVGAQLVADLSEVSPAGLRQERGRVSAQVGPGEQGFSKAFQELASKVNIQLQRDWKTRLRSGVAEPAARLEVQTIYASLAQWLQLKKAMESSARSLISDVRIEAVSAQGAMVSLGYVGTSEQLKQDLARFGGVLEQTPRGAELRLASGQ